jgi:hypothetical protein
VTDTQASTTISPELGQEITGVADRIAEIVRGLAATTDPMARNSTWSVLETAAHLAAANGHFAQIASGAQPPRHGDGTKEGFASANAALLERFTLRDREKLADLISGAAAAFCTQVRSRPATDVVQTPLDEMDMVEFCGYLLAHMLGHGCAIAESLGQPSLVSRRHVELMVPFLVVSMPRLADAAVVGDLDARYELRLRGITRLAVRCDRGTVTVREGRPSPVDCVVSMEPRSFFLLYAGLRTPWSLIARGQLGVWGRRPWLGPRFTRCFRFP